MTIYLFILSVKGHSVYDRYYIVYFTPKFLTLVRMRSLSILLVITQNLEQCLEHSKQLNKYLLN